MRNSSERCSYSMDYENSDSRFSPTNPRVKSFCCWRPTWQNSGYCVWHSDSEEKSTEALIESRSKKPERLDGAVLRDLKLKDQISFSNCSLYEVDFSNSDFSGALFSFAYIEKSNFQESTIQDADFHSAEIIKSDFTDIDATGTDFSRAIGWFSEFKNSKLINADFSNADFEEAEFSGSDLRYSNMEDVNFDHADLSDCELESIDFSKTSLWRVDFSNSHLSATDFTKADLKEITARSANFWGANFTQANLLRAGLYSSRLRDAVFEDTNLRKAFLSDARFEDALFIRSDLRGARLGSARYYQAVFSNVRINSDTNFGDKCKYESLAEKGLKNEREPDPLKAAEWTYRRLKTICADNALSSMAQYYHIRKEEVARKRRRKEYGWRDTKYLVSTANRYLTLHGESLKHVVLSSASVIIISGLIYPFIGGIADSADNLYAIDSLSELLTKEGIYDLLQGIYFSTITFTTIGYGDLHPEGAGSKVLVGLESLVGALLIALFVAVLIRQVSR